MAFFLIDIRDVKIPWTDTKWAYSKFENLLFSIYFLKEDISFDILSICKQQKTCFSFFFLR